MFEDVQNPLLESTTKWHQPFPVEIPYYPIASTKHHSSSSQPVDPSLCVRDAFVPSHLPAYPPTHTYKKTKILPGDNAVKLDSKKRSHRDSQHSHDGNSVVMNRGDSERRKLLKSSNIQSVQHSLALIEDSIDNTEQPQLDQIWITLLYILYAMFWMLDMNVCSSFVIMTYCTTNSDVNLTTEDMYRMYVPPSLLNFLTLTHKYS